MHHHPSVSAREPHNWPPPRAPASLTSCISKANNAFTSMLMLCHTANCCVDPLTGHDAAHQQLLACWQVAAKLRDAICVAQQKLLHSQLKPVCNLGYIISGLHLQQCVHACRGRLKVVQDRLAGILEARQQAALLSQCCRQLNVIVLAVF